MRKELTVFILFIAAALMAWMYWANFDKKRPQPLTGQMVPAFTTQSIAGKTFSTATARQNHKVYLVNFWATHCEPCREEMPLLDELFKSLDPAWFEFVSLNEDYVKTDDERKNLITKFKTKIPFSFDVYADKDFMIADQFGTSRIPETFVIDSTGKIVYELRGLMLKKDKEELIKLLHSLEPKSDP
jgi:thiol-disulfide isomerase/thioredoxin